MQKWSLEKFVEERGMKEATKVWGVSRQAVESAIAEGRAINITLIGGIYEVEELKNLNSYIPDHNQ